MTVTSAAEVLALDEREELDELRGSQPGIWLRSATEARLILRGRLALIGPDEIEVDSYLVEIRAPRGGRSEVPAVFEIGGRIPRIADRHVFTDTGACCIEHPVEYLLRRRQRIAQYVNEQVRSYFIAQTHFEHFGAWPHGELRHGIGGTTQLCIVHFGDVDIAIIAAALDLFDGHGAKHQPCPCGSGRKFMKCHYGRLRKAKAWPEPARAELRRQIGAHGGRASIENPCNQGLRSAASATQAIARGVLRDTSRGRRTEGT